MGYSCFNSSIMKNQNITAIDFFCGMGGSTTGAKTAGISVTHAANHEKTAIKCHAANHPNTEHDLVNLKTCNVDRYPKYPTFALFSPECRAHTVASGKVKPTLHKQLNLLEDEVIDQNAEQSRLTAYEVVRFTQYLQPKFAIVENVVEFNKYHLFNKWLREITSLGYKYKILSLNSQFFGVPQSRDRMFVVFWKKSLPTPNLNHAPGAYCTGCNSKINATQWWKRATCKIGKYKQQYLYICTECSQRLAKPVTVTPDINNAASIIDWSIEAPIIGKRNTPLSPNTLNRIRQQLEKYKNTPFITSYYSSGGAAAVGQPLPTITTHEKHALVIPPPFLVQYYSRDDATSSIDKPLPTITLRVSHIPGHVTIPAKWLTNNPRHALAVPHSFHVEDCGFRMLDVNELKLGMGFTSETILIGSKKVKVKLLGNAVTPAVMTWIITQCIEAIK